MFRDLRFPKPAALCALVVGASIACFLPALQNGFLAWDDAGYIVENPYIRKLSFDTIGWAFTSYYVNYWAPLTWLSLAVDHAFWGLDPVGYHLTNAILHGLNAGLFFLVALRLLRAVGSWGGNDESSPPPGRALATAALAALLFALHPLRVESVAWAVERKDVLALFFGLLAILAWLAHAMGPAGADARGGLLPTSRAYWASVLLFFLSLCSKGMLVSLPLVLLVLDWFPLRRPARSTWPRLALEKAPYASLAGLVTVLTARAHAVTTKSLAEIDLVSRVLIGFQSLVAYLRLTLMPVDISPMWMHPGNVQVTPAHVAAIAVTVALAAGCVLTARRRPVFAAAGAIYLVTLLPFLGLVQDGPQLMAARFTYLPATALSLLAAVGFAALYDCFRASRGGQAAVIATAVVLVLGCVAVTVRDISTWRDDLALWNRVIELSPHATGRQYFMRGLANQRFQHWPDALADLDEAYAIATRKGYRQAHEIVAAKARVYRDMGDVDRALAEFDRAIAEAPQPVAAYHMERGALRSAKGMTALAEEDFRLSSAL